MTQNHIEYRQVGRSGLTVSTVGLGCNNLGRSGTVTQTQEGSNAVVHAALDAATLLRLLTCIVVIMVLGFWLEIGRASCRERV